MAAIGLSVRGAAAPYAARWEIRMAGLALAHSILLIQFPVAPIIALGVWWNSNTISHNFVHRPFFRSRTANGLFGAWLSVLLGIPQSFWRDRHLAHHAGVTPRIRFTAELFVQIALVLALWIAVAALSPRFFLAAYLPGYLAGLGLCQLHGFYEHARGTTSYYGRLYNLLFLNDGYHAEHHANPATHWTRLPDRLEAARISRWPSPLRWIEDCGLEGLERLALHWPWLQRYLLRTHAKAIGELIGGLRGIDQVLIVGGGLFPRTALILQRLIRGAQIRIVDASRPNLDEGRRRLEAASEGIEFEHRRYHAGQPAACDLLVIPLCFSGDRKSLYAHPPARYVLVHDWIWRRRGASRIVSLSLLKRINLVCR